jgi:hypothetical protein
MSRGYTGARSVVTSTGAIPNLTAGREQHIDDLDALVNRPIEVGPAAGDLDVGVGSGRGAVSVFRLVRFLGPPAEPDVPVPEHSAFHTSVPLGQAVMVVAVHGRGILCPGGGNG